MEALSGFSMKRGQSEGVSFQDFVSDLHRDPESLSVFVATATTGILR